MKVNPKNDTIRKLLKHPTAGAFRTEGSSDWPDDAFTARRIADGDITVGERGHKPEEEEEDTPAENEPAAKKEEEKPPVEEKPERTRRTRPE